ncbi:hypothetical protein GPECTOR_34g755 [Gonium pectorale]|uniref:Malonyl-CoA:ACP transacylase (MAT) domain-containing protein n=1 Tax=Gonium pectorale TaxID=33097 RepID=A0A150GCM1_GONPE|nr:hypothetical protein GPECTOR_34g755 [Gonium pectorale]|eukprot:KXZ47596.1 hypothetical protein GPECTOR_34g755 [Gonium pectorale]
MPRDLRGSGRYPPQTRHAAFAFYSAVRLGDPEMLAKIMQVDPYFVTQDNGAGAPIHFAVTYRQLDMVHHLLNLGASVNQRDPRGLTPLHRAAHLAHLDGYLEIYELLLSRGADPSILSEDFDPYLSPGPKSPQQMAVDDPRVRAALQALEDKYASVPKVGGWRTWGRAGRVIFLFPGQGSQSVGMLSSAASLPAVAAMLETAKQVLGYDLLEICTKGPQSALDDTRVAQPALFVAGLAAVELLRQRDPRVVDSCAGCAGLSLGEYTALVFAGALSFEEGLRVVKARGEAMAAAAAAPPGSGARPHGMLSVVGLGDAALAGLAAEAEAGGPPGSVCRLANYLFPQGRVVSGHTDLLEDVARKARDAGALKAQMLLVSGAFHTSLMAPAREELMKALSTVQFKPPRMPVYSNVTAAPFPASSPGAASADPRDIPALLGRQLVEPVQWEATLAALLAPPAAGAGVAAAAASDVMMYELGPGQQIKAMVKRMSLDVWRRMGNVQP